jgi:hypothetical protein
LRSFIALFAAIGAAGALAAGVGPAQGASAATSCTGYARAVADHLRPGAAKGSPEYRAVYFPTFDECLRRGGATAMPGGLAAAPWYLPKPPAPAGNPYTPTPPASPNPPPVANPPAPPATPNPPPVANPPAPPAGPTPAQILATGKQKVAQSLPGGMSFPLAVKAGLEGCGKFAIFQANAAGPNGSAKWQETGERRGQLVRPEGRRHRRRLHLLAASEPGFADDQVQDRASLRLPAQPRRRGQSWLRWHRGRARLPELRHRPGRLADLPQGRLHPGRAGALGRRAAKRRDFGIP